MFEKIKKIDDFLRVKMNLEIYKLIWVEKLVFKVISSNLMAEKMGFEPTVVLATLRFQRSTFGHSDTSLLGTIKIYL